MSLFNAPLYAKYSMLGVPYCERVFWLSLDETIFAGELQLISWLKEQAPRKQDR